MRKQKNRSSMVIVVGLMMFLLIGFRASTVVGQDKVDEQSDILVLKSFKPQFLSPIAIVKLLGADQIGDGAYWRWLDDSQSGELSVRLNSASNLVIFNGTEALIESAMAIIALADIAPRQIEIEVLIVEIDVNKAEDLGYDWSMFLDRARASVSWSYEDREQEQVRKDSRQTFPGNFKNSSETLTETDSENGRISTSANVDLLDALHILDQNGSGSVRVAPRILTLNNRAATIIDGQRVTYVTRYSSYSNLYQTDSMDAGLIIKATPSLGESGYITLDLVTEFTGMGSSISGSPIKSGQIIENTIIVADGESALLGGFSREVESVSHRRLPILGRLIPFLFSRKITSYSDIETIIVLTPRVVDFDTGLDDAELEAFSEPETE